MNTDLIKTVIDSMVHSDLTDLELSQEGWTLRLSRQSARAGDVSSSLHSRKVQPGPPSASKAIAAAEVLAPMFGVVHRSPAPNEPAFVEVGQAVVAGQTLCLIEAMKVFVDIRADRDAVVSAILIQSGQEVVSGQPLMRFE